MRSAEIAAIGPATELRVCGMLNQKKHTWDPVSFLEVWTEENVDEQPANLKIAHELAKRFVTDAAAQGFTLVDFNFDDAGLMRSIVQAMAAPRV